MTMKYPVHNDTVYLAWLYYTADRRNKSTCNTGIMLARVKGMNMQITLLPYQIAAQACVSVIAEGVARIFSGWVGGDILDFQGVRDPMFAYLYGQNKKNCRARGSADPSPTPVADAPSHSLIFERSRCFPYIPLHLGNSFFCQSRL